MRREREYILSEHSAVNQQSVNWASSIVGALQQKTESLLTLVFRTGLITIQTVFLSSSCLAVHYKWITYFTKPIYHRSNEYTLNLEQVCIMHKIKSKNWLQITRRILLIFKSKASVLSDTFGNRINEPWSDKYAVYFLFGPTKNEQKST